MSVVVVGSVAYDGVETPHGRVDRMLGGACTYIALASSYFAKTKIVGVVGDDFASEDERFLVDRGIDIEGLERVPGKTFFWSGVYSADMNDRTTLRTNLNVFAGFDPKLPESYRAAPYLLLGNIQPALQRSVRAQMNGVRLVGGDTMNYWIKDYREELLDTIREWDFLQVTRVRSIESSMAFPITKNAQSLTVSATSSGSPNEEVLASLRIDGRDGGGRPFVGRRSLKNCASGWGRDL